MFNRILISLLFIVAILLLIGFYYIDNFLNSFRSSDLILGLFVEIIGVIITVVLVEKVFFKNKHKILTLTNKSPVEMMEISIKRTSRNILSQIGLFDSSPSSNKNWNQSNPCEALSNSIQTNSLSNLINVEFNRDHLLDIRQIAFNLKATATTIFQFIDEIKPLPDPRFKNLAGEFNIYSDFLDSWTNKIESLYIEDFEGNKMIIADKSKTVNAHLLDTISLLLQIYELIKENKISADI